MFQKQLNLFLLLLFIFVSSIFCSWLEECPEQRKSLGRCLAGLCPFEAECIDDHCCEFPKLPLIKPESMEINNVTQKPHVAGKATVPMLPFGKPKSSEEEENKPLTSEEIKQAGIPSTTTTTTTTKTTTPRRPRNKKRPLPPTTTTTTTLSPPESVSPTEDPLCFDGSYSIGECMDEYCPDGYGCENGYCCKCPSLPCVPKITTAKPPTNIFTLTPNSFETSSESSEDEKEEEEGEKGEELTTSPPTTPPTTTTTTMKPKMKKFRVTTTTTFPSSKNETNVSNNVITGIPTNSTTSPPLISIPSTTTKLSTTTEEDYSTKDVCLVGYPIGECVDGKCPENHECIQNYCCEITPAINCSDLVRSCKKHLCNKIQYLNFMTEQCGRTCQRCDQQKQTDLKPKRPKRCRDSRNDCEEWAAEGFCKSALYNLEQKRHLCGKSCKLC